MTKIVMTGATGYLGKLVVERILADTDWEIISLQRRLIDPVARVRQVPWDFREERTWRPFMTDGAKYILHLGANVHALKSLQNPGMFIQDNVVGTYSVLELARIVKPELFVYMSTAEVLGGRDEGYSGALDPLRPSNPYAASKASAELLCQSYFHSFGVPAVVIRTMNLFGPTQTDESKFIPMVRKMIAAGETVKIHTKDGKPGVRQWLRGEDCAECLLTTLKLATPGNVYHLVGEEISNLQIAKYTALDMGAELKYELVEQPITHCWRYAMKFGPGAWQ